MTQLAHNDGACAGRVSGGLPRLAVGKRGLDAVTTAAGRGERLMAGVRKVGAARLALGICPGHMPKAQCIEP